jgi:hypothetical protein
VSNYVTQAPLRAVTPPVVSSSSNKRNSKRKAAPVIKSELLAPDIHVDLPAASLEPQTLKILNRWFCMIQTAYSDSFRNRCGDRYYLLLICYVLCAVCMFCLLCVVCCVLCVVYCMQCPHFDQIVRSPHKVSSMLEQ